MSSGLLSRPSRQLLPLLLLLRMPRRVSHHVLLASRAFSRYTPCYDKPVCIPERKPVIQTKPRDLGDRGVSLLTRNPSEASKEDFLSQLRAIQSGSQNNEKIAQSIDPTIVILTTPTFVTGSSWIDDMPFMSELLGIAVDHKLSESRKSRYLNVILAVVDRLPTPWKVHEGERDDAGAEGFAIMLNYPDTIAPRLWSYTGKDAGPASLTFCFNSQTERRPDGRHKCLGWAELPLANTLFCNGLPSTLFAEKWHKNKNLQRHEWVRLTRKMKTKQHIYLPAISGKVTVASPAIPLTPWRQIASGLGNIVRQLSTVKRVSAVKGDVLGEEEVVEIETATKEGEVAKEIDSADEGTLAEREEVVEIETATEEGEVAKEIDSADEGTLAEREEVVEIETATEEGEVAKEIDSADEGTLAEREEVVEIETATNEDGVSEEAVFVPASQELEATVDNFFEVTGKPPRTVQVWAVIISEQQLRALETLPDGSCKAVTKETIQMNWTQQKSPRETKYLNWLIRHGGRMHRVLSGGGGWGIKQGLLSLDPELKFGSAVDARYDFEESASAEDEQRQALGDIASPGDYIQFFIPDETPLEKVSETGLDPGYPENVVGCIPSSIDSVPVKTENKPSAAFAVIPSLFGALTEHGLYLSKWDLHESWRLKTSKLQRTKINMPYTMLAQRQSIEHNLPQADTVEDGKGENVSVDGNQDGEGENGSDNGNQDGESKP